ncbi:hypothetical protein [Paraburkholderia sacchari]|uniref:Uncharacterized protein n=1 Tax=Paraburkholderia sacchari TaxID=159450 RepID=A0A8T6ZL61_9BURK|nr:hypothetical protein [Paraburkholderia sacchari]NLP65516.1 hypothetical protein [Paraburkholderia sacchari]
MINFCEWPNEQASRGGVSVRVLPGHDPVQMSREGALHLFRLLQRYNWCLSNVEGYRSRWATYWPAIKPVERALLVLFVTANCGGQFGRRMVAVDAPVEFERFEYVPDVAPLSARIAREFQAILTLHYGRLGDRKDICDWLHSRCPKEFALLVSVGGLSPALGADVIDPESVRKSSRERFIECGWDRKGASAIATALSKHLLWFYKTREAALC